MPKPKIKFNFQSWLSVEQLRQMTCIVPISVGQNYHEGEAFEETMQGVHNTFARVIIVVADSIQRWTMAIPQQGVDPETLRDEANRLGKEWLERNKKAIEILQDKLVGIIHWDEIMRNPEVQTKLKELQSLYREGEAITRRPREEGEFFINFYDKVEATIKSTYGRKYRTTIGYNPQSRFADMSREYVLEESAAFCLFPNIGKFLTDPQMQHLEGNAHLYPSKLNQAMYWLLQDINKSKRFGILAPIEVVIEEVRKTAGLNPLSPPSPSSATTSPIIAPQSAVAQSFFASRQFSDSPMISSGSYAVAMKQDEVVLLSNSLSQFLSETGRLNGRLHRFQELFAEAVKCPGCVDRTDYQELMSLREILTQTLSRLRSPQPQTETTTAPAAPSATATM